MGIKEIKKLIAKGNTKEAISLSLNKLSDHQNQIGDQLILLSSQYSKLEGIQGLNLLSSDETQRRESNISFNLLSILSEMETSTIGFDKTENVYEGVDNSKVVFLGSNPVDTIRLAIDIESREIGRILRRNQERFKLTKEFAITLNLLKELMLYESPQIIHFSGYSTSLGMVFHNNLEHTEIITYDEIVPLFKLSKVKCIVLNTQYSISLADKLSNHVEYCIGARSKISNESRISFSTGFYTALIYGKSYHEAFEIGIAGIGDDRHNYELFCKR